MRQRKNQRPHGSEPPGSLIFLAPGDVSKGRVEPIGWMRTCLAFAERGFDVQLVALRTRSPDAVPRRQVWSHFQVPQRFTIRVLPTLLRHNSRTAWFRLWALLVVPPLAAWRLAAQALRPRRLIVYGRSPVLMAPWVVLSRLLPARRRPKLVYETHALTHSGARLMAAVDLVVVTSRKLQRDVTEELGVPPNRVACIPLGPFNDVHEHPKEEARAGLGLPVEARIACYSGKMIEEQNEFLLQTAKRVRERVEDFRLMLVGGNPTIDEWTRRRVEQLSLDGTVVATGFIEPGRVELYQSAADILVFHMSDRLPHYPYCTPAKGFEYQAMARPIVATDLPLFDEVFGVDGERAVRVRERTPDALADAIEATLQLEDGGQAMARRAQRWMAPRTWDARVDAVLGALAR